MKQYELEISYPHQTNPSEAQVSGVFDAHAIQSKFTHMNWNQLLILQLQMQAASTTFTVTDPDTQQSIQIQMKEFASSDQLEFQLESDIAVETSKKNLFGLLTLKSKDYVSFDQLRMTEVQHLLGQFLNGDVERIKAQYLESIAKVEPVKKSLLSGKI